MEHKKQNSFVLYTDYIQHVSESLIRYQRKQAKKTLATLKSGLNISDILGGCGVAYFMNQWNELIEKYQK